MPLYSYRCDDCGETLEVLHRVDELRVRCGLDCKLRGSGSFGKGPVTRLVEAAQIDVSSKTGGGGGGAQDRRRAEARRQAALARAGGPLTESDINTLKRGGVSVYRKESEGRWERDGAAPDGRAPATIHRPEED